MKSKSFSWEIVIAGVILTAVAIYFTGTGGMSKSEKSKTIHKSPDPQTTIAKNSSNLVINLKNLSDLKKLDSLSTNKDVDSLVIQLPNLNKTIRIKTNKALQDTNRDLVDKVNSAITGLADLVNEQVSVAFEQNAIYLRSESANNALISKTFPASGIKNVSLQTSGGTIQARGYQGNRIIVDIGSDKDVSKSDFDKMYKVSYSNNNGTLKVDVSQKGSGFSLKDLFEGNSKPANISVKIPDNMTLHARSSGGYLKASHLNNSVYLHTSGGLIDIDHLKGNIDVHTSGGLIRANQIMGDMTMKTSGGSLKVTDSSGKMHVSTSGGNIDLKGVKGNIYARTSAGNIEARIEKLTDNVNLKTSAGNIHIYIPQKSATHLNLDGTRIHLNSNMDVNGSVSQSSVDGTLNGGGNTTIRAHTSIGYIKVN